MTNHAKNYMAAMGFDKSDFIPCEVCQNPSVDLHHVIPRSKFGSKRKAEQDHHSNIIALCRLHHEEAHGEFASEVREVLKRIVNKRKLI